MTAPSVPCRGWRSNATEYKREHQRRYRKQRYLNGGRVLMVDSIGCRRRLQALMCNGFTLQYMAERLGYKSKQRVWEMVNGVRCDRVTPQTYRNVCELFDELWDREAHGRDANYARTVAWRNCYAPALAWDIETIDHLNAQPQGIPGYPVIEEDAA